MDGTIKRILFLFQIILIGFTLNLPAQTLREIESHSVSLPNGWRLTPVGKLLPLGDLPLNIAVSPSKKLAAITNNGESDQTIQLVDVEHEVILDSIIIGKAWLGLTFSDNGKFYGPNPTRKGDVVVYRPVKVSTLNHSCPVYIDHLMLR
jgi:DNA-binding beta-propeller fold protein YncE